MAGATLLFLSAASVTAFNALGTDPVRPYASRVVVPYASRVVAAARACESEQEAVDSSGLYASLKQRRSQFAARQDAAVQERKLVEALAGDWPSAEIASAALWQHWFGEEGETARSAVELAAKSEQPAALQDLMEAYPDWCEPVNRLATLRYMQGEFTESVELCLRVLRMKPWHFGALSGIVMCHAKLGDVAEANRWASEAMPRPGDGRKAWVKRMVGLLDERLAELAELSD